MRAVVCNAFGPPETLSLEERPIPTPNEGEVRIRVSAAGVDFADMLMVAGRYQVKPLTPFIPGSECCGVIDALGPGVSGWSVGDPIIAASVDGGFFAEFACVPAERLMPWPEGLGAEVAAGFLLGHGTAWFGLVERGGLKAGETVLVTGAGGGVGVAAIEVAKRSGAKVIAAAGSPEKLALARKHGADEAIDYRAENLRDRIKELTGGRGYDVLFDTVGGDMFDEALRAGAAYARLLVIGFASGEVPQIPANLLLVKNLTVLGYYWGAYRRSHADQLRAGFRELLGWYREGRIKPKVSATFPLEGANEGLDLLRRRGSTGKVVLKVDPNL